VKPMLGAWARRSGTEGKVVVITDHYLPAYDDESRKIIPHRPGMGARSRIDSFYDAQGICHIVLPERAPPAGHVRGRRRQPFAHRRRIRATCSHRRHGNVGVLSRRDLAESAAHDRHEFAGRLGAGVSAKD